MPARPLLKLFALLPVLAIALAACGDAKFQTVSHDPLAVPPDVNARPPRVQLGADSPAFQQQSWQTVFREGAQAQGTLPDATIVQADGETGFLRKLGVQNALPDIRQKINSSPADGTPFATKFVDELLAWRGPASAVAQGTAKPVNKAATPKSLANDGGMGTPTFEQTKPHSWLASLF